MEEDKQKMIEEIGKLKLLLKDENFDNYVDEGVLCFTNDCRRATIILLWSIFLFFLYKKIEEFGFTEFAKECKDRINFKKPIRNTYNLNDIKDKELLFVCRMAGFYDTNINSQLDILLTDRNNLAGHVSQAPITSYKLYYFAEQIFSYITVINNLDFKKVPKSFFEKLKVTEDEEEMRTIISTLEFEKLKNYADHCLSEISFISNIDDYEKNKGLYLFLSLLPKVREKDDEKIVFFEMVFLKLINKKIPLPDMFIEKMPLYSGYSAIKKIIVSKYLDDIVYLFVESSSFRAANAMSTSILHFRNNLTTEQVRLIGEAYISNGQISSAYNTKIKGYLKIIFDENKEKVSKELIDELRKGGLEIK